MKLFEKCPVCGGEIVEKGVEKLLRGGTNTAVLRVVAEVCLKCGSDKIGGQFLTLYQT